VSVPAGGGPGGWWDGPEQFEQVFAAKTSTTHNGDSDETPDDRAGGV